MAESMVLTITGFLINPPVNVIDAGGEWQYVAATATVNGSGEGVTLLATKRVMGVVSNGSVQPVGAASMLTANLQFAGGDPGSVPPNMTLQGVHDFGTGNETGSVSSASPELSEFIGGNFTFVAPTLTIFVPGLGAAGASRGTPAKTPAGPSA